jgi:hypothetical protein
LADTFLVKALEGILRQQLFLFIIYQTEVINITDKSIEETAFLIEDYFKKLDMIGEAK